MKAIDPTAEIGSPLTIINGKIGKHCMIGNYSRFCYSSIDDYSYIGENTRVFSSEIAKYCSISWNVSINPANHDYHRMTQHPILYAPRFGMIKKREDSYYNQFDKVIIGNDVWIGCNALIMGGVKIGDGALIGAGSRISKDVPPYAIVIGNNEILRYRFEPEIIEALLDLKWWNANSEKIKECISFFADRPNLDIIKKVKNILCK